MIWRLYHGIISGSRKSVLGAVHRQFKINHTLSWRDFSFLNFCALDFPRRLDFSKMVTLNVDNNNDMLIFWILVTVFYLEIFAALKVIIIRISVTSSHQHHCSLIRVFLNKNDPEFLPKIQDKKWTIVISSIVSDGTIFDRNWIVHSQLRFTDRVYNPSCYLISQDLVPRLDFCRKWIFRVN